LASAKARVYAFFQERFRLLWDQVAVAMGQQAQAQQHDDAPEPPPAGGVVSAPAQLLGSLWSSYGPSIIASGAALLTKGATAAPTRPAAAPRPAPADSTLEQRKKQLEAELAALNAQAAGV